MEERVYLRPAVLGDLAVLFALQLDPEANRMAGTKVRDAAAFEAAWGKNLGDPGIVARVIVRGGAVVGSISCFQMEGVDAVGYWIGREFWGRGIATRALSLLLEEVTRRPLHASAAAANLGSIRVLERCGFRKTGTHMGEETERYVGCEVATFVLE